MSERCVVLIITPPRQALFANVVADIHPPLTQGIDSVPLRLAAVVEQQFPTAYLPLYHLQYGYYTLDKDAIRQYLRDYQPKVVIIANDYFISNRTTACFPAALEIAALCKEEYPDIRTVFVGKHAIVRPHEHFQNGRAANDHTQVADAVVAGEAEDVILELVAALLSGDDRNLTSIPKVYYWRDGAVRCTEPAETWPDVDELPSPAYHLLQEHLPALLTREKPYFAQVPLTLRTSYGCVYECPYCAGIPQWRQYRTRSAAKIAADVDAAQTALGHEAQFIFLDDELFTCRLDHVQGVAEVFAQRGIMLEGALTHVHLFNAKVANAMARFCRNVIFGAENFDNSVLASLGKNQSRESIKAACEIANTAGLGVRLEFIVGLPGETSESIASNLNYVYNALAQGWADQITPYILCPHPGTAYGEQPQEYGITIAHRRYEEYIEEDSYPVYRTVHLTRSQIGLYFLLAQKTIRMALANRRLATARGISIPMAEYSPALFEQFFSEFTKGDKT